MGDAAGIAELMALQHMADPEVKGYGEKEGARIEALLRNRQELVAALSNFENDDGCVPAAIWWQAQDALAKAKELDND